MRYAVRHSTAYEYGGDVAHSHHLLHLKPREVDFQRSLKHSIAIDRDVNVVPGIGIRASEMQFDSVHRCDLAGLQRRMQLSEWSRLRVHACIVTAPRRHDRQQIAVKKWIV